MEEGWGRQNEILVSFATGFAQFADGAAVGSGSP